MFESGYCVWARVRVCVCVCTRLAVILKKKTREDELLD